MVGMSKMAEKCRTSFMNVSNMQLARVQTRIAKAHIALGQNFKGPHDNVTKLLNFGNFSTAA